MELPLPLQVEHLYVLSINTNSFVSNLKPLPSQSWHFSCASIIKNKSSYSEKHADNQ
jgi:hypothetical protein